MSTNRTLPVFGTIASRFNDAGVNGAVVALVAYGFTQGWRKNLWAVPSLALLAVPISLSQTRSAMLGAIAGIVTLLILLGRARAIAGLAVLVVAAYFAAPGSFRERVRSGWDPHDPNTRNRIELFQTSVRLIRDNPVFGVGPKNVQVEAPRYRVNREFPDWLYQHMHNNFLQIAAERGGAVNHDLRPMLGDDIGQHPSVRQRRIMRQPRIIDHIDLVHALRNELCGQAVHARAGQHRAGLHAQPVG